MATYSPPHFRGLLGQGFAQSLGSAPGAQNSYASSSGWDASHADSVHGLSPGTTAAWLRQQGIHEALSNAKQAAYNPYLQMTAGMQFGRKYRG